MAKAMQDALDQALATLINARTSLLLDSGKVVFRMCADLALKVKLKADAACKTAWIDGRTLGYNPTFVLSLTHGQRVFLVAHEIMHVALLHPFRRGGRDHKLFNVAGDKVINYILREAGFDCSIPGILFAEGKEVGQSTEWVFAHLKEEMPPPQPQPQPDGGEAGTPGDDESGDGDGQEDGSDGGETGDEAGESEQEGEGQGESDEAGEGQGSGAGAGDGDGESESDGDGTGSGSGSGSGEGEAGDADDDGSGSGDEYDDPCGEVRDAPTGVDEDGQEAPTEQEWQQRVAASTVRAKMAGTIPGSMAIAVEDALRTRVDVRKLLLSFMKQHTRTDYTFTRPNRRYLTTGFSLPSLHKPSMGEVAIYVDTSGSMDSIALRKAKGLIERVIAEVKPKAVSVWYADTRVARCDRFTQGQPLDWRPQGGGGTSYIPGLTAIEADAHRPVCIIAITDLQVDRDDFPEVAPRIPVMWLATDRRHYRGGITSAPYGQVVHVGE